MKSFATKVLEGVCSEKEALRQAKSDAADRCATSAEIAAQFGLASRQYREANSLAKGAMIEVNSVHRACRLVRSPQYN